MPVDDDDVPIRSSRRKKKSALAAPIILIAALCIVLLVIGCLVLVKLNRSSEAAKGSANGVAKNKTVQAPEGKGGIREATPQPTRDPVHDRQDEFSSGSFIQGSLCMGFLVAIAIAYVVASILMAIWVIQDCRNRSVENGVFWTLLIFPFNWMALLIYMASRPHGSLVRCEKCGNKRLAYVGVCPHCRQPVVARGGVS